MSDARRKALEDYAKSVGEGLPFSEDFIGKTSDIENDALLARNLSEDALASQVRKNTGIPSPHKYASPIVKEDYLNRLIAERYPEIKDPNIRLGNEDSYNHGTGEILVRDRPDLDAMAGKGFHEAGHKYDAEILKHSGKELDLADLRKAKASGLDLKGMDPTQAYELYAKKHHANIPDLREGTYGLGALKSYLKSGTFRGIAPAMLKGAAVGAGGLASIAAEAADAESEGSSPEQAAFLRESDEYNRRKKALQNEEMRPALEKMYEEADAGQMYDARRDALQNLKRR